MSSLHDNAVLVTGGGSGLGLALVERFVREGAHVAALDIAGAKLAELGGRYPSVATYECDVRSMSEVQEATDDVVARFGRLDVLVGVQGVWDANQRLLDLPPSIISSVFDEVFGVNVKGYLHAARAAAPALIESQGSIIFTLSNAAFLPDGGGPCYVASKHAIVGLVRQLAFELAPRVRVNGVAPGAIADSDLRSAGALGPGHGSQADVSREERERRVKEITPLGILSTGADYGGLYVLLASRDQSSMVTGHVIEAFQGMGIRGLRTQSGLGGTS